jgi:uncharacterized RDD family membrane protein YckC
LSPPRSRPVSGVSLLWYPATLIPIIGFAVAIISGWLPFLLFPIALFLFLFWIFSFGFAVYGKLSQTKGPRL